MHDPFDRRISCGGTALVKGRLRNSGKVWNKIFDEELDSIIRRNDLFKDMPFLWIDLSYRYGIKNDMNLEFMRIDKKYGMLPIGLELDMEILQWADQNNLDLFHDIFMIAALEALIQVSKKYKLPVEPFLEERAKYGNIPNSIEECQSYRRPTKTLKSGMINSENNIYVQS